MRTIFFRPAFQVFMWIFTPFFKSRVAKVHIQCPVQAPDSSLPILFVANHMSWWDGFLLLRLHQAMARENPYYTVMLERELRHYPWFRLMGCLGIQPGSMPSLRTFLHALKLLRTKNRSFSLCFYPQGRIWPAQKRPLGFHHGVEAIARSLAPVQVVPVAIRFETLNTCSPHAFVQATSIIRITNASETEGLAQTLENDVSLQLDELDIKLNSLGEEAACQM